MKDGLEDTFGFYIDLRQFMYSSNVLKNMSDFRTQTGAQPIP